MDSVSFAELLEAVDGVPLFGNGTRAFAVAADSGFFVPPVLVVKEDLGDLESQVILVSARGAAGKSRTAKELSHRVQAPLWRLEMDSAVGRAALPLNLNLYLGSVDALTDISQSSRRPIIFIDSLDEARARVSAQSWDEFLESVADAAARGPRIALFGRDRTLEEVWVKLADLGRSLAWLEVSHFSGDSQRDYIDGQVSERRAAAMDGSHYVDARDAVLVALAGSVDDGSAETFVGYAPVLDAVVAVLLDQQNHFLLSQEFASKHGSSRHLQVLREILLGLLTRDQQKLAPLAAELGLDAELVYTPDEQIDWLVYTLAGGPEPKLAHITDAAKRYEYVQKLRSFLDDHPFRSENNWASAVFEAYATAQRLHGALPREGLTGVGHRSGLLFDFVAAADERLILDEWQFAALHASILAGESAGSAATVSAAQAGEGVLEGTMEVTRPSGALRLDFELLPDSSSEVVLRGPLESLTLSTPAGIRIPPLESGKVIGPDLYLRCESIVVEGTEARFARVSNSGADDGAEILIEVTGGSVQLPAIISTGPTPGTFELAVPEAATLAFPWTTYRGSLPDEIGFDSRSKAVRFLNKLQNLARSHGHSDGRATFYMKLQGRQPLKADLLKDVLRYLEGAGVVRQEGELVFVTSEADRHRFSGKGVPGQQTIEEEWSYWGPLVEGIEGIVAGFR